MAKFKLNSTWAIIIIGAVIIWGASQGWFQFIIQTPAPVQTPPPENLQPTPAATYNTCSQVCTASGFSKSYDFVTSCKAGEFKVTYGYPGQTPILVCCCYNAAPAGTCTETDGGNVPTTPGTTTTIENGVNVNRMDYCVDSTTLNEFWCLPDGTWQGGRHSCEPGQTCLSSRSGGYCHTVTWNEGDTVMSGSGSGSVVSGGQGYAEIDLSKYGLATGGNCQLGAQLSVNWVYANSQCTGITGTEGMLWQFYDSLGLEYERTDATPVSWTVDLHPRGHVLSWDGHTPWRAIARQIPGIAPGCIINYDYTVRVYIYDCLL